MRPLDNPFNEFVPRESRGILNCRSIPIRIPAILKKEMRPQEGKGQRVSPPLSVKETVRRSTQGYSAQSSSVKTGDVALCRRHHQFIEMTDNRHRKRKTESSQHIGCTSEVAVEGLTMCLYSRRPQIAEFARHKGATGRITM